MEKHVQKPVTEKFYVPDNDFRVLLINSSEEQGKVVSNSYLPPG